MFPHDFFKSLKFIFFNLGLIPNENPPSQVKSVNRVERIDKNSGPQIPLNTIYSQLTVVDLNSLLSQENRNKR